VNNYCDNSSFLDLISVPESYSLGENFSRSGKYVPAEYEKVVWPALSLGTDHLYT
jgi:hypothetical protein